MQKDFIQIWLGLKYDNFLKIIPPYCVQCAGLCDMSLKILWSAGTCRTFHSHQNQFYRGSQQTNSTPVCKTIKYLLAKIREKKLFSLVPFKLTQVDAVDTPQCTRRPCTYCTVGWSDFEEEDKMVHFLLHVVSRCCRAPFPKFHVLMLPFHLSQGLRQFWRYSFIPTIKWANFLKYIFKG